MELNGRTRDEDPTPGVRRVGRLGHGTRLVVAVGAGTALALVAAGVAAASPSGGTGAPRAATVAASSSSTATHSPAAHPVLRHILRHAVSGQVELRVKGGALETFNFDRGVVQTVSATSIVIAPASAPSTTVSATITSSTHFRGLTESQLQPGDRAVLVYQGGTAVVVGARAPKATTSPGS